MTTHPSRVRSLDIARGLVMVLMAIDHVRVYAAVPAGVCVGLLYVACRWRRRRKLVVGGAPLASAAAMRDPAKPDTQPDQYLPDLPTAHRPPPINPSPEGGGVNPIDTSSMPRGDDDETTWRNSPEFHDRPGAPRRPDINLRSPPPTG